MAGRSAWTAGGADSHPNLLAGLEILDELGRGAHAVVFRARRDGREYALKMLAAETADRDEAADAMRREAGLLACVAHPAVGRVYEVGELDGTPYLVMDLLRGSTLAELLAAGPLPVGQVLRLGTELADALAAAHRVGVVHRDVKPQNVVVGEDGGPKLVDFGLATHSRQRITDEAAGTFAYSAPEQTGMLARTVDGRADLYSLGVLLFECLAGTRPFESPDVGELIRLHAVAPPPDLSTRRPDVPAELATIVNRLLAKDPDDRYPDGASLAADLRALASGEHEAPASARRPLVGRDAELAKLRTRWDQARQGGGAVLRLTGPAGIGKTHVADELADHVRDGGHPVLTLTCRAGAAPLAPVRAALDQYVRELDRLPGADRDAALQRLRTASGAAASVLQLLSPALARVLQAPELPAEDRQEQLATAAVLFVAGLAKVEGGLLLYVDSADLVDEGTGRVLRELSATPPEHLLILTTEPTGGAGDEIPLTPLDEPEVASLAATQLGGTPVAPQLARQLCTRSGGNPLAVLEYVRAMLDAAVIRPSWGNWLLDEAALDRLALPADVLDLIVTRIDALPERARRLLVAAAVIGRPFRPEFLADVCRAVPEMRSADRPGVSADPSEVITADVPEVLTAVEEAVARGILEFHEGAYAFLHRRAREAILADEPAPVIRALHQRVAETLAPGQGNEIPDRWHEVPGQWHEIPGQGHEIPSHGNEIPGQWYEIAGHYAEGDRDRDPQAMYAACFAAARAALDEQAPGRALEYLDLAADAAARAGIEPDSGYHRSAGLARLRTGRFDAAQASLEAAYAAEADPIRRAELLGVLAEVQHHNFASHESVATARRALAETGHRVPRNALLLVLSTLAYFVAGLVVGRSRRWFGTAAGADRDRYRVQARLFETGAMGAGVGDQKLVFLCLHLRSMYAVNRLGPGPEYVLLQGALSMFCIGVGLRPLGRGASRRAHAAARATGDPRLVAHVAWGEAVSETALHGIDANSGSGLRAVVQEHGRWLDLGEYLGAVAILGTVLVFRGYVREAANWYDRAVHRLAAAVTVPRNPVAQIGVQVAAAGGQRDLAMQRLGEMREAMVREVDDPLQKVYTAIAGLYAAVQPAEVGEEFDIAVEEFQRLRMRPMLVWPIQRQLWLDIVRGRLAQLRTARQRTRRHARQRRDARSARSGGVRRHGRCAGTATRCTPTTCRPPASRRPRCAGSPAPS